MHLTWGTTATTQSFGSATTSSASTHHSEGTVSMLRQQETDVHSVTVRAQAGGGGASPRLTRLRPFATAGAVLLGVGVVTFTPQSAGPALGLNTFREVTLTADDTGLPDLLAPWIDQFNTGSETATALTNNFFLAPGVGLQQMTANMSGYLQDWFNDPATSNASAEQMQSNLDAVLTGYGLQNADSATTTTVLAHTLEGTPGRDGHMLLFGQIPGYLPASDAAEITPIINFLASPASGIIMGEIGPWISPWVALGNSIADGDSFNEILANMTGAFFNGATLDLNSLLPAINGAGLFPAGMAVTNLDIGFGGLLSTGGVGVNADGIGGSIFNSVGINIDGVPSIHTIDAPSQPIGPIGALEGWGQLIAVLLGWDGSGSPLADVTLPIIPTDSLDAAAGAATDLSTLWQDLLAAF